MALRLPIGGTTLKMLIASGVLYMIMMGSTFSSLGVVLPYMIKSLGMDFATAGFGFTLLALAAGISSILPALTIKRWGGRATLGLGVLTLMLAYGLLAIAPGVVLYDLGAALLGIGFSLIGAVPALHILAAWEDRNRPLVFGIYLAFGGLGGALWPSIVETVIGGLGGWRNYWWFMVVLIGVAGIASLSILRERKVDMADKDASADGWTLIEALRTPQFYIIGAGIAATYFIATTINAFTMSYLTMIGVTTGVAVVTFSIQSACHAAFPLLMGGIAARIGARNLLVIGLAIQVIGMAALAAGKSTAMLTVFAIGVGGGYGTIFLATTYSLQTYFGHRNYAQIFGANQLFTTISVVSPFIVGWVADVTGRFDISFGACAALLAVVTATAMTLKPPVRRLPIVAVAAE
jgi:MFS transporter, OFA family, oxalate/formate antiporter